MAESKTKSHTSTEPYNRIILIGNGFDLAHGLKTSYADFIKWLEDKEKKNLILIKIINQTFLR